MKSNKGLYPIISRTICLMGIILVIVGSCKKKEETPLPEDITLPQLTTLLVNNITQTTAISGGKITSDGGSSITARGVCWGTGLNPTINDGKTIDGTGSGDFLSNLSGLKANTSYNLRAYATNAKGTSYGNTLSFNTLKAITADFTVDKNIIYEGESVQFTNTSIGSPTTISWVFQDGIPPVSSEANPLVRFNNTGTFSAKLTITKDAESDFKSLDIFSREFTLTVSPKTVIINQTTSYIFTITYPLGSTHKIEYSINPNLGTLEDSSYTSPTGFSNSQLVVLTVTSDLLPTIKDDADIYLVGSSDFEGCNGFQTFQSNDIMIENNVWNAGSITDYTQCVYHLNIDNKQYFAWKWEYPVTATNVNAYPEIIYGWKPWYPSSTTSNLPKQINTINSLKADYEVENVIIGGGYNLAFDNWIIDSAAATPENIKFEFMIWENTYNLVPFGDYVATVNTTNGTYQLFKGEPTWEPPGTNWTYVAFKRINGRTKGVVDVDEMLSYLINTGIVPSHYYLSSLEIGNEVTSGRGFAVVKRFDITIQ